MQEENKSYQHKTIFDDDDNENDQLFFQDFSADAPKLPLASEQSATNKSYAAPTKFDLAAFAKHLHENRLSIVQLRKSVKLTEDDERELLRLLEKRKSSMPQHQQETELSPPPPLPPTDKDDKPVGEDHPQDAVPQRPVQKKPSVLLQKLRQSKTEAPPPPDDDEEESQGKQPSSSVHKCLAFTLKKHSPFKEAAAAAVPSPSKSTTSQRVHESEAERRQRVRKSLSMNDIKKIAAASQEKTEVLETIAEQQPEPEPTTSSKPALSSTKKSLTRKLSLTVNNSGRSLGLFGSLRQTNRTQSPFRGLVRNLSKRSPRPQQSADTNNNNHHPMSRAAMAVMQHDQQQQQRQREPQQNQDLTSSTTITSISTTNDNRQEASSSSPTNLITHLLAKAGKSRRTKTVNMQAASKERKEKAKSRVVRRTIIYVPPDSINFMKSLEDGSAGLTPPPPVPAIPKAVAAAAAATKEEKEEEHDDIGSVLNYYDDESLYDYYRSRDSTLPPQLEGLELREMEDGTVEWGIVKKQGNRKSFYVKGKQGTYVEEEEEEEEEDHNVLALMGLDNPTTTTTTNLSSSSSSPPPIPRRSPRRRMDNNSAIKDQEARHIATTTSRKDASTTDVYFAPQQTLPSLLQMIAASQDDENTQKNNKKKASSVEEQLDEMMRSFSSP